MQAISPGLYVRRDGHAFRALVLRNANALGVYPLTQLQQAARFENIHRMLREPQL